MQFKSSFQYTIPCSEQSQENDLINDVHYAMIVLKEKKVQKQYIDSNDSWQSEFSISQSFLDCLKIRMSMVLRQPIMVNIALTQVLATIQLIASPSLCAQLFIEKDCPFSLTSTLNTVIPTSFFCSLLVALDASQHAIEANWWIQSIYPCYRDELECSQQSGWHGEGRLRLCGSLPHPIL